MPDQAASVIALAGFSFRHAGADRPALTEVTLEIREGEYVGVLGATGSGVSTLLTALNGVVPQLVRGEATGAISVAGRDPREVPVADVAGSLGMVFDDPDLASAQPTVADEVAFGLENMGADPGEMGVRIAAALEAVGLGGFEERVPVTLSGGELQRLAIAGALVCGPRILVLDEPTANLDPTGRETVYGVLRRLNREHRVTVIVADRDVEAIARDATRVVVLAEGRVVEDGTPAAVLGAPDALARVGVAGTEPAALAAAVGLAAPVPAGVREVARHLALRPIATPRAKPAADARFTDTARERLVTARGVAYRYPRADRSAVVDVGLEVAEGEVVGIVGPNGCGKTTLLRLLNGLLRPAAGRIDVDGMDTTRHPVRSLAGHVASVFQDPNQQLFASTVAEEVALGPRALGWSEARIGERVRELAVVLELDEVLTRHPLRLGRAERKLVALGAALAVGPRVLLLDEPTTGADARLATIVETRVHAAAAEGAAVLVASHDMAFLGRVASRLVVLDAGRVIADAPAREAFADATLLAMAGLAAPPVSQVALAVAPAGPSPWPPVTLEEAVAVLRPAAISIGPDAEATA